MALKKKVTHRVEVPHEPGQWVEFREVGWRTLERARDLRVEKAIKSYRNFGSELLQVITESKEEGTPTPAVDPKDEYDSTVMLHSSIVAWSYEAAVTQDNIDDLDEVTADWAMGVIVGFYVHDEVDEGKDSSPSSEL